MSVPEEKLQKSSQSTDVDITREYVVGTGSFSARIAQVLSNFTDDLQWIVGYDVYERMARDPTVSKNIQFQKLSVQSEGVQLHPAVSKPKTDEIDPQKLQEYQLSQDIKDFHQRSIEGLHRPITQIIGEMLVALKRSHSVAEITYKEPAATGIDAYKLLLKSIKVKPRNTTAFVIDAYRNVLGLTAWIYDTILPASKLASGQQIIPLEKFAVLAFETEDEDPRGINPLRAAYNFWQAKCLVPSLHLIWLEKSGVPSTIGFTAEKAAYEQDPDDASAVKTPQEAMAANLALLVSASSAAFPFGAKVEKLEVASRGEQFKSAIDTFDQQIDYALALQSGATKDSETGSYSSKRGLKDVLDILIWSRKQSVAQVLQGVLNKGTEYNFGAEYVYLTPKVFVGDEEGRDWAMDAEALSKLAKILTRSQILALLAELGVPPPEDGEDAPVTHDKPLDNPSDKTGSAPAD